MTELKLIVAGIIALIGITIGINVSFGIGVFGPTRQQDVTITRLYVDTSGSGDSKASHYMVGTDAGVFEVDNSMILGIWNADEIYTKLRENRRYRITTEGNKVLGFFFQSYPYITHVTELPNEVEQQ